MPLFEHAWSKGYTRFAAAEAAQQQWHEDVKTSYQGLLASKAQSWITGYNSNLAGHEYGNTRYNIFATGGVEYGKRLRAAAEGSYPAIEFSAGA